MNKNALLLLILILFLTTSLYASIDFKADWLGKPDGMPYQFLGDKDNNEDGSPDEMYYKDGDTELLIEDTDYNGKVDAVTYYENEILIKKEVDIDGDGEWNERYWYKEKELDRVEKRKCINSHYTG